MAEKPPDQGSLTRGGARPFQCHREYGTGRRFHLKTVDVQGLALPYQRFCVSGLR
jgi:hypothetical protein